MLMNPYLMKLNGQTSSMMSHLSPHHKVSAQNPQNRADLQTDPRKGRKRVNISTQRKHPHQMMHFANNP